MSVHHHPSAEMLEGFAAGHVDEAQRIVLATHIHHCPSCRGWTRTLEQIGGTVLESVQPSALREDALTRVRARLGEAQAPAPVRTERLDIPGLPAAMHRLETGPWSFVAPGLDVRKVRLADSRSRLFFLRSKPQAQFLPHSHTGLELTCVLQGGFEHDGAHYGPGDVDTGAPGVDHVIHISPGAPCISLVALSGRLTFSGLLGHIAGLLVRL